MLKDLPAVSHLEIFEIATHFVKKLSLSSRIGDLVVPKDTINKHQEA
jgi:hypothetical protein